MGPTTATTVGDRGSLQIENSVVWAATIEVTVQRDGATIAHAQGSNRDVF